MLSPTQRCYDIRVTRRPTSLVRDQLLQVVIFLLYKTAAWVHWHHGIHCADEVHDIWVRIGKTTEKDVQKNCPLH